MQVICPACGAAAHLPDDSDVTHVICGGCGKRLSARTLLNPPSDELPGSSVDQLAAAYENRGEPAPMVRPALPPNVAHSTAPKPKSVMRWSVPAMAGLVAAAVTGLAVYLVVSHSLGDSVSAPAAAVVATGPVPAAPGKDGAAQRLAKIRRLRSLASTAALNGQLRESFQEYEQLSLVASEQRSSDPEFVAMVAAAQAEQGKVFSLLMEQQQKQPAAGPAVTPGEPPATAPAGTVASSPPVAPMQKAVPSAPATQPETLAAIAGNPADLQPEIAGVPPGPRAVRTYSNDNGVTDSEIGDAIVRGILYLQRRFRNGVVDVDALPIVRAGGMLRNAFGPMNFGPRGFRGPPGGQGGRRGGSGGGGGGGGDRTDVSSIEGAATADGFDALAAYALLHAGQATDGKYMQKDDPFTIKMLDALKRMDMPYTYWRSLRASALAVLNRVQDKSAVEADVAWLVRAQRGGGYTYLSYEDPRTVQGPKEWDNSNSQYGLLGVWSGAEAGTSVPSNYWTQVADHWTTTQLPDGQWGYELFDEMPRLSMTLAGVASELVSSDYVDECAGNGKGRLTPVEAGLNWLDTGDNCTSDIADNQWHGYVLYGLERVGLASGYKYFGNHDWYSEFARSLVASQNRDGSWAGGDSSTTVMETSYSLLFLARGRHPILYNHIRYGGAWNTHPRAISHLAKFASKTLERPLNWQIVNFSRPWYDWMDSPVLYLSGTDAPDLSPGDYQQLQAFANGGGLIFTQADNNSAAFNQWVDRLVRKIFPAYEFSNIPKDHPIYSTVFDIKQPPLLKVVSNGSRILLIHSPKDIAAGWQANWVDAKKSSFQMGINLFVYAAGKANFKNRLLSPYLPAYTAGVNRTYPVARLEYGGHWNPEPYAWTRFERFFSFATKDGIDEKRVTLAGLTPALAPLAVLTGTVRNDFTDAEAAAARSYVDGGGVLLIDACGGRPEFSRSVTTTLLSKAFPDATLSPLPSDYPLLLASRPNADDLRKPLLRPYAVEHGGHELPLLGFSHGKGHVIFSRLDLTTGLLDTNQWGIMGYDPSYASSLLTNAVLWTAARARE